MRHLIGFCCTLVFLTACEPEIDGPAGDIRLLFDNQTSQQLEVWVYLGEDRESYLCAPGDRCDIGSHAAFGTTSLPSDSMTALVAFESAGGETGPEVFRREPMTDDGWTVDGMPVTDALRACCATIDAVLTVTDADLTRP